MTDERKQLFDLIVQLRIGKLSVSEFCSNFETIYNLKLDKRSLVPAELEAFRELFEKVVWYSPHSDERKTIPNYLGEEDVRKASEVAADQLGL